MELTLASSNAPPKTNNDGITEIGKKNMSIIDANTGEKLIGIKGWAWGGKHLLTNDSDTGILSEEHFANDDDDDDYIIIVIKCNGAINL